ncbi:hypothetical protein [Nocardia amamiensis]|nr:hypothetical protein [Nocardia amamiensis]
MTTADLRNVPLYQHFGFTLTDDWSLATLDIHAMHRVGSAR